MFKVNEEYDPWSDNNLIDKKLAAGKKSDEEKIACLDTAYGGEPRPTQLIEFIAGSPIPNDQPVGEDGKKKRPLPLPKELGGHSPLFKREKMNKLTQFKEKLIIRLFIILYLISLVLQVN